GYDGRRRTIPVQSNSPDRGEMFQLVLASVQHQPVELDRGSRTGSVRHDRYGERAFPGVVGGSFESLEQLEACVTETTDDGFGGFDCGDRVPGRISVLELFRRR